MDVLLSDEESLLRDAVVQQFGKVVPTSVAGLGGDDDTAIWDRLAHGDLLGLGVPEELGGTGTAADAGLVVTALGGLLTPAPIVGCGLWAAQLLTCSGADPAIVQGLVSGRHRLAVALRPDLRGLAAPADPGTPLAWDAAGAEAALLVGPDGEVSTAALGDPLPGFDLTRRVRPCDPATAPDLGELGKLDLAAARRWEALALGTLAADLVGCMEGAVQLGVAHVLAREQFGVPIGSFQAVQHLLADAHVSVAGARSLARYASWAVDHRGGDEALRAARTAKAYCSEAGRRVCEAVVQVHGGMGMTWESLAHVFLRRALTDRAVLGDESVHYRLIV